AAPRWRCRARSTRPEKPSTRRASTWPSSASGSARPRSPTSANRAARPEPASAGRRRLSRRGRDRPRPRLAVELPGPAAEAHEEVVSLAQRRGGQVTLVLEDGDVLRERGAGLLD